MVQFISDECAAIAVNLFGSGESSVPDGLTSDTAVLADQALAVAEVVHQVSSRHASMSIVGHSYGGAVAATAAELCNRDLSAIVLYEANALQLLPSGGTVERRTRRYWNEMVQHQVKGDMEAFGDAFATFWFGAGAWAKMPVAAQQKLLQQLRGLDLQAGGLLNEGFAAGTVEFLRRTAARKHYVHGTVATNPLIKELAAVLSADASFSLHSTPAEWQAGHMGPVTHAERVLPILAECAGLAREGLSPSRRLWTYDVWGLAHCPRPC
jgi:pimeloyl-ACP methyl ester carboxylesterase